MCVHSTLLYSNPTHSGNIFRQGNPSHPTNERRITSIVKEGGIWFIISRNPTLQSNNGTNEILLTWLQRQRRPCQHFTIHFGPSTYTKSWEKSALNYSKAIKSIKMEVRRRKEERVVKLKWNYNPVPFPFLLAQNAKESIRRRNFIFQK